MNDNLKLPPYYNSDKVNEIEKSKLSVSEVLDNFIAKDRSHFIKGIQKNKVTYDKLIESANEDSYKLLMEQFNDYSCLSEIANEFSEYYFNNVEKLENEA